MVNNRAREIEELQCVVAISAAAARADTAANRLLEIATDKDLREMALCIRGQAESLHDLVRFVNTRVAPRATTDNGRRGRAAPF